VGGETQDLPRRHRTALHLMSLYLHQRLMELMAPELAAPAENLPNLSPGEIECIKWLIAGKSDWEMSEILKIAEATAHWRIERAKQKFGVKTRAQLTALAVHHGVVAP
jgi:DNA-binding CsgD family transcriptional regulator